MATVTIEQSSSSPEWMDFETDLDMVLSTMKSMFGELPSAPAPQESPHLPGYVLPEVEQSGFTDGLNGTGTVTHDINPFQCGATTVPPYGGVLADHNVGAARAGFMSGANMQPLCCQCPHGMRWLQFPPQFLVPQPDGPVAGVSPMYLDNSFMPYGFVNHQQGACFPCQKEQVPALEGGSVSSPGSLRKRGVEPNGAYIRRPPNAFMVFMRENREIITRTLKPKHSVETNTILGEMWRKMSTDEQEIYYQKAMEERRIHTEKYPEWSSQDNYGKKVKRQRKKTSSEVRVHLLFCEYEIKIYFLNLNEAPDFVRMFFIEVLWFGRMFSLYICIWTSNTEVDGVCYSAMFHVLSSTSGSVFMSSLKTVCPPKNWTYSLLKLMSVRSAKC
ncbi:uncharacterized protein LOC128763496 isoform X3 [Synchiropus splendidus]|uniref:uncharacterized protein LOC128763496 isoform X3 n=1 Tax=Synchiropus splendidus TaxID=270530 RepID=UPI00237E1A97|nr:uncharacterized protein LOC128763496 isoform X3 [Synchiropus splendidus]